MITQLSGLVKRFKATNFVTLYDVNFAISFILLYMVKNPLFFTQKCLKYYEENGCKVYTRPDCVSILNIK